MTVFLNGQLLPEERATVSVLDRGFLYGDGLFETLRVSNGKPFRWAQHWTRLEAGAAFLKIVLPFSSELLREAAAQLVRGHRVSDAIIRLTVSRGVGPRGYSPKGAERPTVVMTLHPAPPLEKESISQWRLVTSSFRLPANEPLAQFKTCNKLPQILARAEADTAGADESLLSNTDGHLVEGSSSNLFWVQNDAVCTPPLACGILPGVTRGAVLELCQTLGVPVRQEPISPRALRGVEGVFVSLSTIGIAEAVSLDQEPLSRSALVAMVGAAYARLLDAG